MLILVAILVLGTMGLLYAGLLGFAADYFHVEEDPRVAKIMDVLPGANCGACGLAGCRDFAVKLTVAEAGVGDCTAGGDKVALQIAAIMGVEAAATERKTAVVHCGAKQAQRKSKGRYRGIETCLAVSMVDGGGLACSYGCLGQGDCLAACPFGAIEMVEGLPVVDPGKCTACGKCVTVCPRRIISLEPLDVPIYVACSSRDAGALTRKICPVGCIACKICVKQAPELFVITDNLAMVDGTKTGVPFAAALEKCPAKCIVKTAV